MLSSLNFYYAIPGNEAAVLRQRLRACDVRQELGIPRGRVLMRSYGNKDLPDVVWEQFFENIAGHHADMAVRAGSPAFEAVRAGMRKLCRRFERPLFEIQEPGEPPAIACTPAVVALDWIFCAPERMDDALHIVHQTAKHGTEPPPTTSRILRFMGDGNDLPALLWQREYGASAHHRIVKDSFATACPAPGVRVEHSLWECR